MTKPHCYASEFCMAILIAVCLAYGFFIDYALAGW